MPNNILITPGSASIQFSGSAANTIRLQVETSGSIAFYGNSGSLFGITDSLSGSLMSVNDISGLPILEVFSDDRVVMGSFNKNTLVVTGSRIGIDKAVPTTDLDISGSVFITGSLQMNSGGITGSLFGTSSIATTSSYILPAGLPTGIISSSAQINTGSFTGSFIGTLTGTGSWAQSASVAISASFAPMQVGVISSSTQFTSLTAPFTGSFTGSFIGTHSGSTFGTASWAQSASVAISASFAPTAAAFPYSGSAIITGSLLITGSSTGSVVFRVIGKSGELFSIDDNLTGTLLAAVKSDGNPVFEALSDGTIIFGTGSGDLFYTSSYIGIGKIPIITAGSPKLQVNGNTVITGSLTATTGITGSLSGSAATATSASFATTASYVLPVGLPTGIVSSSRQFTTLTDPFTGSFTGSFKGDGAGLTGVTITVFPYSGSAVITGSLLVSNSISGPPALRVSGSVEFLTGSTRVYTAIDSNTFGGLYVQTTTNDVALEVGDAGVFIGSNTSNVNFFAGGITRAFINSNGILPGSDLGNDLGEGSFKWRQIWGGIISASTRITAPSYTSSISNAVGFLGTSSFATTASYALSATATLPVGVVSSSAQFTSLTAPFTGSFTGSFKGDGTGLTGITAVAAPPAGTVSSSAQVVDYIEGVAIAPSILSASIVTSSHVQLVNVTDTTSVNKILVLDTVTNKIFTTSSVGSGGGGGPAFPYVGDAVITGSLTLSGSAARELTVVGDTVITGSVTLASVAGVGMELMVFGDVQATGTVLASNTYSTVLTANQFFL